MQRTKTVDVIFVTSAKDYIAPCAKLSAIIDSIYKDNFVRIPEENSILYEKDFLPFKNFSQNLFGKCHSSKDVVAHSVALIDRVISNTNFILKPNNSNRLLVGIFLLVNRYYKTPNLLFEKIFNLNKNELELIEKEVFYLINSNVEVPKNMLSDYIDQIYAPTNNGNNNK